MYLLLGQKLNPNSLRSALGKSSCYTIPQHVQQNQWRCRHRSCTASHMLKILVLFFGFLRNLNPDNGPDTRLINVNITQDLRLIRCQHFVCIDLIKLSVMQWGSLSTGSNQGNHIPSSHLKPAPPSSFHSVHSLHCQNNQWCDTVTATKSVEAITV